MLKLAENPVETKVQLSDGRAAVIIAEDVTLPYPLVIKYATQDSTAWQVTTVDRDGTVWFCDDGKLTLVNAPEPPVTLTMWGTLYKKAGKYEAYLYETERHAKDCRGCSRKHLPIGPITITIPSGTFE